MLNNHYGYACINLQLFHANPRVFTGRTMIKNTFKTKGIDYASSLSLKNAKDLVRIIKWNIDKGFHFFRMTSDLVPWASEFNLKDMPKYDQFVNILKSAGDLAKDNNIRITAHPGPFNILNSPKKEVVDNCIKDLSVHGEIFDIMGLSRSTYSKINIHIGGSYGDKIKSMERFCKNFQLLPDSVKKRLTVENDDRESLYSTLDLYTGVFKNIGIPIVFDYHHHKFCSGGLSEKDALELAIKTWGNIKPVVHYSESRNIEQKNDQIKPQAHSNYVYDFIDTYGHSVDIMIEAKHKELAVLKYLSLNKIKNF
tara:strand:- start:47 stop:976 length:930 start_codon:yes stop_codon:yes gene_type:complete